MQAVTGMCAKGGRCMFPASHEDRSALLTGRGCVRELNNVRNLKERRDSCTVPFFTCHSRATSARRRLSITHPAGNAGVSPHVCIRHQLADKQQKRGLTTKKITCMPSKAAPAARTIRNPPDIGVGTMVDVSRDRFAFALRCVCVERGARQGVTQTAVPNRWGVCIEKFLLLNPGMSGTSEVGSGCRLIMVEFRGFVFSVQAIGVVAYASIDCLHGSPENFRRDDEYARKIAVRANLRRKGLLLTPPRLQQRTTAPHTSVSPRTRGRSAATRLKHASQCCDTEYP